MNGLCPECWKEMKTCHGDPCHVCRVGGIFSPRDIWRRFSQSINKTK